MTRLRRFSYAVGATVIVLLKDPRMSDALLLRNRWRILVCVGIVLALLAGMGLRQPSPPDEPRFVLAARAMVDSGNWLLPHRGGELYAEKPPVFMWMQAASHTVFGGWDLAFLVPSLLAGLLTLWLTWDLARRLWNRRVAWWAVLALFSCLQFGLMAKRAQIDMVLVAMTTLAMWGLLRHLLERRNLGALWLAGFAAGLGTVTKGVGFLPLLVLLPWALWRWRNRDQARPVGAASARSLWWLLPAFLLGTAVWLGPLGIALLNDPEPSLQAYARELLFKQTGTRYANAWHHVQPAWYYLQVMVTLWLPGSLLLPALLPAWWRRLKRLDGRYWLLLGWSLLVLVFFSASPGKREVYIFPMLPLLCVAAARLCGPACIGRTVHRHAVAQWQCVGARAAGTARNARQPAARTRQLDARLRGGAGRSGRVAAATTRRGIGCAYRIPSVESVRLGPDARAGPLQFGIGIDAAGWPADRSAGRAGHARLA
jgi:4-amino-4-deoxy-L-arabinose transferase-like glycosyltransferase